MKNSANVKISKLIVKLSSNPRKALVAAGILHLLFALMIFGVGRFGFYSQQFDHDGIGQFGLDSHAYQRDADRRAGTLTQSGPIAWLKAPTEFHVRFYSLSFALFRPVLGKSILAAEPVNLLYYLAILIFTFSLTKRLADQRSALLASALVALWPSLLLHTTQFLRDPLFIVSILGLVLVLTNLLTRTYTLGKGVGVGALGVLAAVSLWLVRSEMWIVVRTIVFLGLALFAIRIFRERKFLAGSLAGIVLVFVVSLATTLTFPSPQKISPPTGTRVSDAPPPPPPPPRKGEDTSIWGKIAKRRRGYISAGAGQTGSSTIDPDVNFSSRADILRYVPRAVEIGYLAPFPEMWFTSGYNVRRIGRLLAAAEMIVLYLAEILAVIALWQKRRQLTVWLLALSGAVCITALGLVVVNVGTLYRMRYAFFILLVILAATIAGRFVKLIWLTDSEIDEAGGSPKEITDREVAFARTSSS